MRSSGVLDSPRGLGHHDHLCWGFDDHAAFLAEAERFVADGLRMGQRVLYTAAAPVDELRHHLSGIADLDHLLHRRTIEVLPINQTYAAGRHRGRADQAEAYAVATHAALAAGYSGLRAVADATVLVLDPADRDEFVRYEHRIDRRMAGGLPFSALCAYDRNRLDQRAIDELACVHPLVYGSDVTFRVHAEGPAGLHLSGEIDAWHEDAVRLVFDRTLSAAGPGTVMVRCDLLRFVHHRGLVAMDAAALEHHVELHLVDPPPTVGRVAEILALGAVRSLSS
jgi:hypothetical protein